jgi:hypothetical protein
MGMLHVVPDERGQWRIFEDVRQAPLSEHASATEAELWAFSYVRANDEIVVHDRYGRLRPAVHYDVQEPDTMIGLA